MEEKTIIFSAPSAQLARHGVKDWGYYDDSSQSSWAKEEDKHETQKTKS